MQSWSSNFYDNQFSRDLYIFPYFTPICEINNDVPPLQVLFDKKLCAVQTVEAGKPVEFVCKVDSKSKVTVTWYKSRKVIKESKEYKITYTKDTATLVITETTIEMSGTYTVEVSNEYGKEESSAELTVKGESAVVYIALCCAESWAVMLCRG
ncbi:unc-22 [Cordylochernes scorpioides]|uniref:Unc-22 n=1 Tax=Cordylochernes scorpioides TaxID=51811 RepID=A0ABY6KAQ8_9ARAC|nr:unc-22 [Cordylochernes scorpioides]